MTIRTVIRRARANLALLILGDIPCIANARFDGQTVVLWGDGALIKDCTFVSGDTPAIQARGGELIRIASPHKMNELGRFFDLKPGPK